MEHDSWVNDENVVLPEGFFEELPKPAYWRLLVMPIKPQEVSKGGIVLAKSHQDAQEILNFIGKVVAVGPMAGKHERLGGSGTEASTDFPKVGEYVIYGRYAGQALKYKDVKLLIVNDDEVLATVPNHETLRVTV
jgi:chaperonin GroES